MDADEYTPEYTIMLLSNYLIMLTSADWSVLINALMAGLMIGYGFWIHHIVKQQEKLKDATIQALQAALTAKEAEISKVTGDMAPNIVKAYQAMREHADKMTAEVTKLQEQIRETHEIDLPVRLVSEASGLNLGKTILVDKFEEFMVPIGQEPTLQELEDSLLEALDAIDKEYNSRIKQAKELLDNPKH